MSYATVPSQCQLLPYIMTLSPGYRVYLHGVENTHCDQTDRAVRVIRITDSETNGLADGGSGAEGDNQEPRTYAVLRVWDGSDTGAKTQTLEHLVEQDGNDQDNEAVDGEGDGDTNEDGVEQDTTLQHGDVERHLAVDGGVDLLALLVNERRVLNRNRVVGTLLPHRGSKSVLALRTLACPDHVHHLQPLADILLVKDDEPRRHLRVTHIRRLVGVLTAGTGVGEGVDLGLLLIHLLRHPLLKLNVVCLEAGCVVSGRSRGRCCGDHGAMGVGVRVVFFVTHYTTVRVASQFRVDPHLNNKQGEHGAHHDNTRHRRVVLREQVGKAWVVQALESSWEELKLMLVI